MQDPQRIEVDFRLAITKYFQVVSPQDPRSKILSAMADRIVPIFDSVVDTLRSPFPNIHLNRLMTLAWRGIGQRPKPVIYTVVLPGIPALHVWLETGQTESSPVRGAIIAFPPEWPRQAEQQPYRTMGGVVWGCSQAVDFALNKFPSKPGLSRAQVEEEQRGMVARALARESEFYLSSEPKAPTS